VAPSILGNDNSPQTDSGNHVKKVNFDHQILFEASFDGLVTVGPLLVITDVSQTMYDLAGYSREELPETTTNHQRDEHD
jgi:PAS domain-containing protein